MRDYQTEPLILGISCMYIPMSTCMVNKVEFFFIVMSMWQTLLFGVLGWTPEGVKVISGAARWSCQATPGPNKMSTCGSCGFDKRSALACQALRNKVSRR